MLKYLLSISLALTLLIGCQSKNETESINLSELTIAQIHDSFKNGKFTSEQLVQAYLDRIDEYNEPINAITFINPEALNQAKMLDAEYEQTGVLRPLHGIPFIVKDNINTKGMPTTAGSLALQNFIPEEDAFIINKLIDAGAIIIAKSNMAEWAFSPMHSESSTAGTTRNPYNLEYVPAGSSGGTGAAIAANFATFGLGTDTGNSIRGPSSHNALVGYRTTLGLISREGIVPLFLRNDVVGPMCRNVTDATLVMQVMAGIDPDDPITAYSEGKTADNYTKFIEKNGLKGARIGVLRDVSENNIDPEIKDLFERALFDMDSLGAEILDPIIVPDFFALSDEQWCSTFRADVEAFLATYVKNDTVQTLEDIIRIGTTSNFASSRLEAYSSKTGRWGKVGQPCSDAYTDQRRIAFREAIENVMDSLELDAIVYPSWNNIPARVDHFEEEYAGDNNQIISPATGQPAFTVPMGYARGNLPAGLQFLGRMYAEPTLIRLAYAYEQGTKHRKPPKISKNITKE